MANSSRLIIEYRGQRKFEVRWELGKGNLTPNVYIYILVNPRNGQTFEWELFARRGTIRSVGG